MYRPGNGHFFIDEFYFFTDKCKVRRIKITGCELPTQCIKNISIYFFYFVGMHIQLSLLCVCTLCNSLTRFHIKFNRIAFCFKIGLIKLRKRNYISITVFYQVRTYQVCFLIKFNTWSKQFVVNIFYIGLFAIQNYFLGRYIHHHRIICMIKNRRIQ